MTTGTISAAAQEVIHHYEHLSIGEHTIQCPYFNNRRNGVRGGLRPLIGKGSPKEIEEEIIILGLRHKLDFSQISSEDLTRFLVEKSIGIDCSGFAYYVLAAELQEKKGKKLSRELSFPFTKNPIRKLLTKTRTAENASVKVFAHKSNSTEVALSDIQPGDMICMVGTGYTGIIDHMLIITRIFEEKGLPTIEYTHSLQWSSDGRFNHGVRNGTITLTDLSAPLEEQQWSEQGIGNEDKNGTYRRAKEAASLTIHRLNALID